MYGKGSLCEMTENMQADLVHSRRRSLCGLASALPSGGVPLCPPMPPGLSRAVSVYRKPPGGHTGPPLRFFGHGTDERNSPLQFVSGDRPGRRGRRPLRSYRSCGRPMVVPTEFPGGTGGRWPPLHIPSKKRTASAVRCFSLILPVRKL